MPASLELVKIALQAYAYGDCEIALALAGPHIRWDERASRPEGDLVWGRDKVGRAMRRYLDGWEQYSFELEDVAEVGPGKVVGICREHGKPKEGPAVDRRFGGLWLVEQGKLVSWATYLTPRDAVRAAKELLGANVEQVKLKPAPQPDAASPPESESPPEAESQPEAASPPEASPPEAESQLEPVEDTGPEPSAGPAAERPRKRLLTKSEEQKRAARARARVRRSSRQTA